MKKIVICLLLPLLIGLGGVHAEEVNTDLEDMAYPQEFSDTVYTLQMDGADRYISICGLSYGSYSMDTPHMTHGEFGPNGGLVARLDDMVPGTYTIETHGRGIIQLHDARLVDALTSGESLTHSFVVNESTSFIGFISGRHTRVYELSVEGAQKWALYDLCGNRLESISTGDMFSIVVEVDEPQEVSFVFAEKSTPPMVDLIPGLELPLFVVILIPLVGYGWYRVLSGRGKSEVRGKQDR